MLTRKVFCVIPIGSIGYLSQFFLRLSSKTEASTLTRQKTAKRKSASVAPTGGIPCCFCGKFFPSEPILNLHLGRRHALPVAEVLRENPVDTYRAIFGDSYKRLTDAELRYEGGLVVTLRGADKGNWYSFTKGVGGGPIKAIQQEHGFSFRQAMEFAANLTGMSEEQLRQLKQSDSAHGLTSASSRERTISPEKLKNVETSKNIWAIAKALPGSMAETYLVRHRGISPQVIERLAFRYLPRNEHYQDIIRGDVVSNPALIVPVRNPQGELTGIQRVFLNDKTGDKCREFDYSKKSKGILKGSAGIVQIGSEGGSVYVVEGAETGASVASVIGSEATVLASLSVSLLQEMTDSVLAFNPKMVVLAVDNDVSPDSQKCMRRAYDKLKREMSSRGIDFRLAVPQLPQQDNEEPKNVDWNDVLTILGPKEMRKQLDVAVVCK